MDSILYRKIVSGKLNKKDLKFLNNEVGEYRLLAMNSHGFIRGFCNNKANMIEKTLKEAFYDR